MLSLWSGHLGQCASLFPSTIQKVFILHCLPGTSDKRCGIKNSARMDKYKIIKISKAVVAPKLCHASEHEHGTLSGSVRSP